MLTSPLRYPGGKAKLLPFFAGLVARNKLYSSNYCEPYAGGAGLALKLLASGFVDRITLNDIDPSVWAFWKAVLDMPNEFCQKIYDTEINIDEWFRQREIWKAQDVSDVLSLGFSTFFLNRTNRSGIIEGAGPVGGYKQAGQWKLDARFVKQKHVECIALLQRHRAKITFSNLDALDFLEIVMRYKESFVYLDPPYYVKGSKLYRNFYEHYDHCCIESFLSNARSARWVVSYDDVPEIRSIYNNYDPISYELGYSAGRRGVGKEVLYLSDSLSAPSMTGFTKAAA